MTLNFKIKLQNDTQSSVLYLELSGGYKSEHMWKIIKLYGYGQFAAQMSCLNKKLMMPGYDYHCEHFCMNMNKNFKDAWAKKTVCDGCRIKEIFFIFLYMLISIIVTVIQYFFGEEMPQKYII